MVLFKYVYEMYPTPTIEFKAPAGHHDWPGVINTHYVKAVIENSFILSPIFLIRQGISRISERAIAF